MCVVSACLLKDLTTQGETHKQGCEDTGRRGREHQVVFWGSSRNQQLLSFKRCLQRALLWTSVAHAAGNADPNFLGEELLWFYYCYLFKIVVLHTYLKQWFSKYVILPPNKAICQHLEVFFFFLFLLSQVGRCCSHLSRGPETVEHSIMTRTAPQLTRNVNSVEAEEHWSKGETLWSWLIHDTK